MLIEHRRRAGGLERAVREAEGRADAIDPFGADMEVTGKTW